MKPKQLISPFSWEERQVVIHDRVWYVPTHYDNYASFQFPGWVHPDTFSVDQPIKVEYCSGNGGWIAAKAAQEPGCNWIAIEIKFERVRKVWSKIKNGYLSNLLVVCGEGHTVTSHYFPSGCIEEVFINFPDPWPKRRHIKNRIIQSAFIKEIHRILKPEGILTFVTDDPEYSNWTIHTVRQTSIFDPVFDAPYYVHEWPGYGTSYFEDLWRSKGKEIRYHQFRKR